MGAGDDAVNVSSDAPAHLGNVDGIAGTLTIDGGLGSNTLEVSDYGKTTGAVNATLTANQITGLAPAAINYRAVGGSFSSIRVDGSNTLSNSFTIDGTLTGSPTTVTGGTADDSFTLGSATAAVAINGVSGNNTLTGADATNTWSITGANAGTVNANATFTNVENLIGGSGSDAFVFATAGSLSGDIDGGAGTNTLDYHLFSTPVFVNLGSGTATAIGGTFSSIENVVGGSAATNTLTGDNLGDVFDITGTNSGDVNGPAAFTFSSFQYLVGGAGTNLFAFGPSGVLSGTITGGPGGDTIQGNDAGDVFRITGTNAGSIDGILTAGFTGVENLTGGAGNDDFIFSNGQGVTGAVNGGGGTDTLDYSAYTTPVFVNLGSGATTGVGSIASIENVVGGSATTNTLTGDDGGDTFDVTGANSGDVNGPAAFTFSSFQYLVGGSGDDSFVFTGSAQLTGGIDGGAGSNTLSYAGYGQAVSVQLTGSDADGFTGIRPPVSAARSSTSAP